MPDAHQPVDWEAVYREQLPRVYNFFSYRVNGDEPLAEDLTAATFERAWRFRENYRHDIAAFSTWLFTIARNIANDHFRRYTDALSLDDVAYLADDLQPDDLYQLADERARLAASIARLPDREQEIVSLKYGAGLTNRAIADVTGLSESNVGTILHRIIQRIRAEWETIQ